MAGEGRDDGRGAGTARGRSDVVDLPLELQGMQPRRAQHPVRYGEPGDVNAALRDDP